MSRLSYVELEDEDTQEQSVVVTAKTQQEVQLEKQIAIVKQTVKTENEAKVAQANIDAQKAVWAVLPLQNVNVQSQQELAKEENMAVMISSHNLSEIENVCNKICIMMNGKVMLIL